MSNIRVEISAETDFSVIPVQLFTAFCISAAESHQLIVIIIIRMLASPLVLSQAPLQFRYPVEFVEEPLVDGCQLVDLIHAHAAVEGLQGRRREAHSASHL